MYGDPFEKTKNAIIIIDHQHGGNVQTTIDKVAEKYGVDNSKIVVTGHSIGATKALETLDSAGANGKPYAGGVILSRWAEIDPSNFKDTQLYLTAGSTEGGYNGGYTGQEKRIASEVNAAGGNAHYEDYDDGEHYKKDENGDLKPYTGHNDTLKALKDEKTWDMIAQMQNGEKIDFDAMKNGETDNQNKKDEQNQGQQQTGQTPGQTSSSGEYPSAELDSYEVDFATSSTHEVSEGETIELKYIPYGAEFKEEKKNTKKKKSKTDNTIKTETTKTVEEPPKEGTFKYMVEHNDPAALNYFSFNEKTGILYYATYSWSKTEVNGELESSTYTIKENKVRMSNIRKLGNIPFNFLFSLLQTTNNPEFIAAVADLIENTKIELRIQDQIRFSQTDSISRYAKKTYTKQNINKIENVGTNGDTSDMTYLGAEFPVGPKDEQIYTSCSNSAVVYLKEAHTWCMDFEQEATLNKSHDAPQVEKSEYSSDEIEGLGNYAFFWSNKDSVKAELQEEKEANKKKAEEEAKKAKENGETQTQTQTQNTEKPLTPHNVVEVHRTTSTIPEKSKTETIVANWEISESSEKAINEKRFLGLLKNEKGKYELGVQYDENGKFVPYLLPPDYTEKSYPAITITSAENGEEIDNLIELLSRNSNTQLHEQMLMYMWNIFKKETVYNIDTEALLKMLKTDTSKVKASSVKDYIRAWESASLYEYEYGSSAVHPDLLSEDGERYIVYDDGSPGKNNVPYGMPTLMNGNWHHKEEFAEYGIDVTKLYVGAEVDKEAAKGVFEDLVDRYRKDVENYADNHGFDLESYQIDALTDVHWGWGMSMIEGSFEAAYVAAGGTGDGELDGEILAQMFTPFSSEEAENDRKYADWHLFMEGEYIDRAGNVMEIRNGAGLIMDACEELTEILTEAGFKYPSGKDGKIDYSLLGPSNNIEGFYPWRRPFVY